jgi:hypothetical protein
MTRFPETIGKRGGTHCARLFSSLLGRASCPLCPTVSSLPRIHIPGHSWDVWSRHVEVEDVEGMCPCIFFLYGGTSKRRNRSRGSLPELRILPLCVRLVLSLFRWWKVRSLLFWTGRRICSLRAGWWHLTYEIRRLEEILPSGRRQIVNEADDRLSRSKHDLSGDGKIRRH